MSFFEDASLVLIPSAYKDQKIYSVKPTDGTGDLTFSRASSATRVASNGLIEKVRTNLVLQSNTFSNAAWTKIGGTTLTAGQADYLGGTNAWKWEATGTGTIQLAQSPAGATIRTPSIYAKAGSVSTLSLWIGSAVTFNLSTGTVTSGTGVITSVGNGWYRCSAFGTGISHNPYFIAASAGDYVLISFAQLEEGDIATDYIATTTAAVSVGPVSGLPRLDYLGSTCPRLILEAQRTNTSPYSEQFTSGWASSAGSPVTANTTISPSGYQDADTIAETGNGNYLYQSVTTSSGTFTVSVFAKKGSSTNVGIGLVAGGFTSGMSVQFNFDTQTFATPTNHGSFTSISATSQNYGNGWYRLALTGTTATATTYFFVLGSLVGSAYAANVRLWGAQCEAGAYATSYIPTLGASVTRVTEACSKTGVSSLIGQTAGSVFVEAFVQTGQESQFFWLRNPTGFYTDFMAVIFNVSRQVEFSVVTGGTTQVFITSAAVSQGFHKVAIGYANNDFVLYIDGVQIGTDSSGTPPTCSDLFIDQFIDGGLRNVSKKQALLFKTRLTNAQLAELTA
jgi:hypothetical protein